MTFWAFSQLSACMLPEVSITKMMYSLSTGMPPTAGTVSIFFGAFLSRRCISAVSVWCTATSSCLHVVGDRGVALAGLELAADLGEVAGEHARP